MSKMATPKGEIESMIHKEHADLQRILTISPELFEKVSKSAIKP
jgi:hypothetical protein